MKVNVYNKEGKTVGEVELNAAIFGVEANENLVHQAVVAQQANSRVNLAHTKDRSEVAGTKKKPWRQKGTGRARHGSRRSPIWVGGGITFGPRNIRNFAKKFNKRAKRKALFMTLTSKVAESGFIVVDDLQIDAPKTKQMATVLNALPTVGKRTLVIVNSANENVRRAAKNIPFVDTIAPNSINTVDVLKAGTIVVGSAELDALTNHFVKN
ncbi:50S ribosomal protein L4 [Candidatus Uhrbacteria bacterium]|jgi:large subunit ribosomal protein L4|nr:50S ribosomal protein L4 [Candidatus Uhrbacteria bacterium]